MRLTLAPPHHTLPAFLNLNGRKFIGKRDCMTLLTITYKPSLDKDNENFMLCPEGFLGSMVIQKGIS